MYEIDWLKPCETISDDEIVYRKKDVEDKFKLVNLKKDAVIVLYEESEAWLSFAVLEFNCAIQTEESGEFDDIYLQTVFHGGGTTGSLRECRHTYWGRADGYLFYPDGVVIADALDKLSEYFDDMK